MTAESVSLRISNQFIVPASRLLLFAVVFGIIDRVAEFIINLFQRRITATQEFGGKRRGEIGRN